MIIIILIHFSFLLYILKVAVTHCQLSEKTVTVGLILTVFESFIFTTKRHLKVLTTFIYSRIYNSTKIKEKSHHLSVSKTVCTKITQ